MLERFAGRFLLLRHLGQGGMGEVFLARDLSTGRECALKRLTNRAVENLPEAARREFEALARVRHPALVSVYEFGVSPEGVPFCAMEYVPGVPADRAITAGDWASLAHVAARVARGLEALHQAGVVHGDIKPGNLLMIPGERPGDLPRSVRLVDFGLAVLPGDAHGGHTGTPGYAAPEVVRGSAPSGAADLYSFGATLYALAVGRPPFEGETADAMLFRQKEGPPSALPLEEVGAPPALTALIFRLLSPEVNERPASAREVRRELERIHPAARRPLAELLQAVVVVGREREIARLESSWSKPRGSFIVLQGEAGAGKSALLSELASRSALAGIPTLALSCGALEGSGALIRSLAARLSAEAGLDAGLPRDAVREADLDELAQTVASWVDRFPRGFLVLLDDAERLDPTSRAWIRKLVCREPRPRIHWVLARRPALEGATDEDALLVETGLAERISLGSLDPEAVSRVAAARLGDLPPSELVDFLWTKASGHAGLTIELLRAAAEAKAVVEDDAGLRVSLEKLATVGVPADFEESLLARFDDLPPAARGLAVALAVAARPLDEQGLRLLAPDADDAARSTLRAAGLARVLENGELLIWPPAIGERLALAVDAEERKRLHREALSLPGLSAAERFRHLREAGEVEAALEAAAEAVEETADDRLAASAAELAEARAPAAAAWWHERTARLRMAKRRYAAAIPHAERALELEPTGDARGERWAALVTCLMNAGRLEEAGKTIGRALAEGVSPEVRARLMADDAARLGMMGELDASMTASQIAEREGEKVGSLLAVAIAAEQIALIHYFKGRLEEATAASKRGAAAYDSLGNTIGKIRLLVLDAAIERGRGNVELALRLNEDALNLAREARERFGIEVALDRLGLLRSQLGQWREAVECYEEIFHITIEDGRASGASTALANLAYMAGLMGEAKKALRLSRRAVTLVRRHWARVEGFAWRARAQALRVSGSFKLAEQAARRAVALASRSSIEDQDGCRVELGRVLATAGDWRAAASVWDRVRLRGDSSSSAAIACCLSGRAELRIGNTDAARRKLKDAEAWSREHVSAQASAFVALLSAELSIVEGKVGDALDFATRALQSFERLPASDDWAGSAYDLARLSSKNPSLASQGTAWLEMAERGFQRLGNRRSRERALELLVEELRNKPTPPSSGNHDDRSLIERVSWLIGSISDVNELSQRAMQMAIDQLGAQRGVLLLIDRDTSQLSVMAEKNVDPDTRREALGYSRRIVERVTESGGSVLVGDAPSDPRLRSESVVNLGLRSILCVPLYFGNLVIGAVYLDDARGTHRFDEGDRKTLEGFAHLMAVALQQARGHEETERVKRLLEDENVSLRREIGGRFQFQNVIGASSRMQRVLATVEHAARANTTVLVTGENGTGKELIARTLHHASRRRRGPFVLVNCGAIPEELIESELFGILPNVATGVRARDGRFVQANGGTLFLDEIGVMPLNQQVALLSAIANREITPVGGGKPIHVDVRIVAATNSNLRKLVEEGSFREDLFFRLNVLEIEVPPLRERKSDIPALAQHFLERSAASQERPVPELSPDFNAVLMQSDWPGNVRELQNYIERVLAMNPGPILRPDPLPQDLQGGGSRATRGRPLADTVGDVERRMVVDALKRADGNQSQAARLLGLTEQSLRYRIKKYGMGGARQNRRLRRK